MTYRVKNWTKYQHYKKRCPPWIKLHYETLTSSDWVMLDDSSRVLAIACMLVASRHDGEIPSDPAYIKRVAYLHQEPDFKPLISCGFLEPCKRMLADESAAQADACSEAETDQRQRERDLARSNSNIEEEGLFVIDDEVSAKFDAEAYRKMPKSKWPTNRVVAEISTNPRPDQSESLPLKSPEANAVLAKIQEYWPDYPYEQARVTAAKLHTAYGQKINVLEVIEAAWAGWGPKRTIHDRSGLHVCLASYCNTEAGKAPRASQAPSRGKGGIPHQSEASRPSLRVRLERLNQAIKEGRQIEPHAMVNAWNEAILDECDLEPFNSIRWLIQTLSRNGLAELARNGKILDHSLPAEPRTPKELLEGEEAPDPEFVAQQIAKLTAMKGLE
jgi:hypothetical protein